MKGTMMAAAVLALLAAPGWANDRDWRRFGPGPERFERSNPVTRSLRDLQMIYSRARVDRHESTHFRNALDALAGFQRKAARGDFDNRLLDRAIWNMSHLAEADQLHPRDRAVVRENMFELRSLRSGAYPVGRW